MLFLLSSVLPMYMKEEEEEESKEKKGKEKGRMRVGRTDKKRGSPLSL